MSERVKEDLGAEAEVDETTGADRGDEVEAAQDEDAQGAQGAQDAQDEKGAQDAKDEKDEVGEKAEKSEKSERSAHRVIPLDRHTAVLERERAAREAAEARLAEVSKRQETSEAVKELEARALELSKAHSRAILNGDEDKVAEILREIRSVDRRIVRMEMSAENEAQASAVLEQGRVELAVARLEAEYPVFNPDSEAFDESLTAFAISEQQRMMRSEGLSASKALVKAVEFVVKRFLTPASTEAADEKRGLRAQGDRKKEAVERNLDVSKRQPADLKDAGLDGDKKGLKSPDPDVSKLTAEEFDALPEATRARMRGDFL